MGEFNLCFNSGMVATLLGNHYILLSQLKCRKTVDECCIGYCTLEKVIDDKEHTIICNTAEAEEIKVNDVVSFFDPAGNGTSIVTHRVIEIIEKDGEIFFRTRGDNNNTEDKELVPAKNLVGIYKSRIAGAGHIAMFMQSTAGLIICVVLPIILLVGYDIIRRRIYEKNNKQDTDALLAELEALRAEKAEKEKASIGTGDNSANEN